jgi:hypothetical protein
MEGDGVSLNPRITKDSAGVLWLEWDPDPTSDGYYLYRDGAQISRTFDPARRKAKLGVAATANAGVARADVTLSPVETAAYPDTPDEPPQAGAEWNRVFAPPTGYQVMDFQNQSRGRLYLDVRNGDTGRRHIRRLRISGASPECVKLGIPDVYLEDFQLTDSKGINHQGLNLQAGQNHLRAVRGLIDRIGQPGDKFSHCCYVGPGWSDTAFGAVWFKSASGETFQYYDNPEGLHLMVHCTIGVSSGQEGLVGWDESPSADDIMEVWNTVILDDVQHDSGNLRLRGLIGLAPGANLPSSVDVRGATIVREDPQLDSRGVPRNPRLRITDPAHKAWLPPLAWDGQPHSGMAGCA